MDSQNTSNQKGVTRRGFLKTAAAGAVACSLTASSHSRVIGANDRIRIGLVGCGQRGVGALMKEVHDHSKSQNAEVVVVCDPWRIQREKAAAKAKEWFGTDVDQTISYREILTRDDVDAVLIASCDHQHTRHLEAFARAGKDVYCEKPLAMEIDKLNAACDAVREHEVVVQVGTQLRSLPSMTGAKAFYETGKLGTVARIEQCRNLAQPYWYPRVAEVNEEDVDWEEFLDDRPMRLFDPNVYSGWYGYREFSDGPVPGFGSHFIDLVHYITGAAFPESCVCSGGVYTWKDEFRFTCPDHVQAQWHYPEGFMVSYSSNFGNGDGNSFKFFGNEGVMDLLDWDRPMVSASGTLGNKGKEAPKEAVEPVPHIPHMQDWLECLRSRKTPNASIETGRQHAVAVIMAMKAFDVGRRQVYDPVKREIVEG